jgi:hypothetical protein
MIFTAVSASSTYTVLCVNNPIKQTLFRFDYQVPEWRFVAASYGIILCIVIWEREKNSENLQQQQQQQQHHHLFLDNIQYSTLPTHPCRTGAQYFRTTDRDARYTAQA